MMSVLGQGKGKFSTLEKIKAACKADYSAGALFHAWSNKHNPVVRGPNTPMTTTEMKHLLALKSEGRAITQAVEKMGDQFAYKTATEAIAAYDRGWKPTPQVDAMLVELADFGTSKISWAECANAIATAVPNKSIDSNEQSHALKS